MSNNSEDSERLAIAMRIVARARTEGEEAARELGEGAKCPYHVTRDPLEHAGWVDGWVRGMGLKKKSRARTPAS